MIHELERVPWRAVRALMSSSGRAGEPDMCRFIGNRRYFLGRDDFAYAASAATCPYTSSSHFSSDPSNGQSAVVYRAAIVEMPDQAPRTTCSG